jgi:GR25 family glycosyltransferase involved in LPS biosynthesis
MINTPVYIINLAHRKDRLTETFYQLEKLNFNQALIEVIDAQYSPRNGSIGCAASHAFALATFLFRTDADYCLIVEDDFQVAAGNSIDAAMKIENMLLANADWDVVMLASNQSIPVKSTDLTGVFRVINAQTASAYFVRKKYAPELIRLFYQSANLISSSFFNLEIRWQKHFYALDMLWKNEQIHRTYFAFLPAISVQAESFSDIENKVVNYGV